MKIYPITATILGAHTLAAATARCSEPQASVTSTPMRHPSVHNSVCLARLDDGGRALSTQGQWVPYGDTFYGDEQERLGYAFALSGKGDILAIGSPGYKGIEGQQGAVNVYQFVDDGWEALGSTVVGEPQSMRFAYSLSLSKEGNVLAVGSHQDGGYDYVKTFVREEASWAPLGQVLYGHSHDDYFGRSVALSDDGSIMAINAPFYNRAGILEAGSLSVYHMDDQQQWVPLGQTLMGEENGQFFGFSFSLSGSGTRLVASAHFHHEGGTVGQVQAFELDADHWQPIGQPLQGSPRSDEYGSALDLSSNGAVLAVGAPSYSGDVVDEGQVEMFQWRDTEWVPFGQALHGLSEDRFGSAVALSEDGTTVAILAPYNEGEDEAWGGSMVYRFRDTQWQLLGQPIQGNSSESTFVRPLALSADGQILAVGDIEQGPLGKGGGQVEVFTIR